MPTDISTWRQGIRMGRLASLRGRTADLNMDGLADVVVSGEPLGPLNIFLGTGDGSFQARQLFRTIGNYQFIVEAPALVDFNGDGRLDMVGLADGFRRGIAP